jgi:hypothetical protein
MESFTKSRDILSVFERVAEEDGEEKSKSKPAPLTPKGAAPRLTLPSSFKFALILRVVDEEEICSPPAAGKHF